MAQTTYIARGTDAALNITSATVIKSIAGRSVRLSVLVGGSAAGGVYDTTTTAGASSSNQVFVIPTTVGTYDIDFPHLNGIVVTPGTGQTVALTYY